ncbi:MAG TPA: HAD family hydrolase [Candidatus Saccharimonadales bacterium]|nr:HAD family hydrolase [Candidatus Saccharimonadales bacterium]
MKQLSRPSEARVVVFDIDGVLINSADSILAQAKYWLKHIRNREMTATDLRRAQRVFSETGDPHISLQRILQCSDDEWDANKEQFLKIHNDGFQLLKSRMLPYDGAVQLVLDLSSSKKVAAFTTRKRDFFDSATCPQLIPPPTASTLENIDGLFHTTVTADDVSQIKPHPEGLYTIAKRLGVKPQEMVLIGDSPTDIIAGNKAGSATIAIVHPHSFANKILLSHEKPDHFAQSIDDLRALLTNQA